MKKIFITGCAKTGTTLVRRLFNSFDLNVCNKKEMSIDEFINSNFDVSKRNSNTIFSNTLSENEINRQIDLILKNNLKIVNVLRNKEDTLKSTDGYVSEDRYDNSILQSKKHTNIISYTIEYERLISEPNTIQKEVSDILNLKIIHKWDDYPDFIDINDESLQINEKLNYSLRRIGEKY